MGGASSTEVGGVRVFKVSPDSPAAEAGLEFFFDFIVEINGAKMDPDSTEQFSKKIQESENGEAKLLVYNGRAHTTREVIVKPRKWGGTGLLGAKVRYDSVEEDENQGIRVLEVFPNSPAAHAGLLPFQDFLLGTAQTVFHELDELVAVVTQNMGKPMQVYVYNADTETVRETTLAPNNEWGGEGCIGCDIGTGLLHRIPAPRRPPGAATNYAPSLPVAPQSAVTPPVAAPPTAEAGGAAAALGQGQVVGKLSQQWPPLTAAAPAGTPPAEPVSNDIIAPQMANGVAPTPSPVVTAMQLASTEPPSPAGMPPAPPPTPTDSTEAAPVVDLSSALTAVQGVAAAEMPPPESPGAALL